MDYIPKNIEDMTMGELKELCENPDKYNLTWGEYMKLLAGIERANKIANPQFGGSSDAKVQELERRVSKLENQVRSIAGLFANFYSHNYGTEE